MSKYIGLEVIRTKEEYNNLQERSNTLKDLLSKTSNPLLRLVKKKELEAITNILQLYGKKFRTEKHY